MHRVTIANLKNRKTKRRNVLSMVNKEQSNNSNNIILHSTCVPLPLENVDTDQIIPARFLKATTKEKFSAKICFVTGVIMPTVL